MEHSKTVIFPKDNNDEEFLEIDMLEFEKPHSYSLNSKNEYMNHSIVSKWGRSDEHAIQTYVQKAIGYKILYNNTYFMYNKYYKMIMWPLVFLNCLSLLVQAIFTTLIISSVDCNTNGIFNLIIAVITSSVAIFIYLETTTKYNHLAEGCRKAGQAFSEFADELNRLLNTPRERRANPDTVINLIQMDYKKLIKHYSEYQIPASIYKKLTKNNQYKQILFDIVDNTEFDEFDLHDKNLKKSMIMDKFIESLVQLKKEKHDESIV